MMRDMYPASVRAVWQANDIQIWLEKSGPLYTDLEAKILKHYEPGTDDPMGASTVLFSEADDYDLLTPGKVSYASWLILRSAAPDDVVVLKVRCDEVGGRR